ncbi:DUF4412 domain-containing protein [Galbibacter sp. BG1]|uniref:DUF4412 domain-containing protein n=1 Tax=Galbibacter sp. BG1 TaxID=1170699 RepID=UPI0015C032E6|nr:DUF4412 domain-containing protein [Galbibacter sp. BG1]QLE01277.1 DUF4412 domain-containing protein [Galbibacter sp. BG1]
MKRFWGCVGIIFLMLPTSTSAQFWKKLQKKVEEKVEQKVIEKTSDKAAETTDSALEKVLNPSIFNVDSTGVGFGMQSSEGLPEIYEFDWVYEMEMQTQKAGEQITMDYFLKHEATYWGMKMEQNSMPMFMVYDMQNDATVMFMEQNGNKQMMVTKMGGIVGSIAEESEGMEGYSLKEIGSKTILGYDCQGYVAENEEYTITMYVTFSAPVSFTDMFSNTKKIPAGFNQKWMHQNGKDGLLMEMEMIDKKKGKNNLLMKCTALEKKSFQIAKANYKNFGG